MYVAQTGRILFGVAMGIAAMSCATSGSGVGLKAYRPMVFGADGGETLNYLATLNFSADTSYFASYSGGVILEFQPLDTTYKVTWAPLVNPGQKGSVVARLRNVSSSPFTDGDFTLDPYNSSHQYAYLWVGTAKKSDGTEWRGFGVYTLNNAGTVSGEWSLVAPQKIQVCATANPHKRPAIHETPPPSTGCRFLAENIPSVTTRLASLIMPNAYASTRAATAALAGGLGGLWISCSGGCCQISTD